MIDPARIESVGRFRVERFIAEGGFAWVFEVVDPDLGPGARRALKMLKPGTDLERFRNEARHLAALNHPNLVQIFEFGHDEVTGCAFFVMPFVSGGTLADRLRGADGRSPLSQREICRIFEGVLAGLAALHQRGIVHRDIKPANVLLWPDDSAVLSDLGIARVGDSGMTKTGVAMGTALYMSPEQARGRPAGPASDLFSVGLCLYQALEGHTVYDSLPDLDSSSGQEVLLYLGSLIHAQRDLDFAFAATPAALQPLITRACHIEPTKRHRDAGEMLAELRRAQGGRGEHGAELEPELRDQGDSLNWPRILAIAGVLALVALASWGLLRTVQVGPKDLLKGAQKHHKGIEDLLGTLDQRREPPPQPLRTRVQDSLGMSDRLLARSGELIEAGDKDAAAPWLASARSALDEACGALERDYLLPQLGAARTQLDGSVGELEQAGAAETVKDDWRALQKLLGPAREPVEEGPVCDRAASAGERLSRVEAAQAAALGLEAPLRTAFERDANAAHEEAIQARTLAEQSRVADPAYTAALARGDEVLTAGDRAADAGDPRAARARYREAQKDYERAAALAPAALAREDAVARKADVTRATDGDLGKGAEVHARADQAYEEGRFADAAQLFRDAVRSYEERLGEVARGEGARDAKARASAAKQRAEAAGAARLATGTFERGEQQLAEGDRLFEAGKHELAERAYADAASLFGECEADIERRKQALGDSAKAAEEQLAKLAPRGCAQLESADARESCSLADGRLQEGLKKLSASEVAEAERAVSDATFLLQKADRIEREWQHHPVPPQLVSRSPTAASLSQEQGRPLDLSVEAKGSGGESLTYAWRVNGRTVAETGPRLRLTPTEDSRVEVVVSGPGGSSPPASWDVRVARDEAPVVSLEPSRPSALRPGETLTIEARGRDPEGKAVSYEFVVDEKVVQSGARSRFELKPVRAGSYTVAVRARDPAGHTGEDRIVVAVEKAPEPEPRPSPAPIAPAPVVATTKPEVTNSAPALTLHAAPGPLEVDKAREITARMTDPDGDRMSVQFRLDGKLVSEKSPYSFKPTKPGTYKITALATDARGARSPERTLTIEVPRPSSAVADIGRVIDAYRAAVASCDSAQIGRAAPGLSSVAKLRYKQLCERCPDPELQSTVKVDPSAIRLKGQDAAEADLTIYLACKSTGDESLQRQTGVLARERGSWRLTQIRPQAGGR